MQRSKQRDKYCERIEKLITRVAVNKKGFGVLPKQYQMKKKFVKRMCALYILVYVKIKLNELDMQYKKLGKRYNMLRISIKN